MKGKGLLVKTGFKYGSHFRAYEGDPSKQHARYLVHAVPEDYTAMWPEVSRAVRLAHGVKKEILLGRVTDEGGRVRQPEQIPALIQNSFGTELDEPVRVAPFVVVPGRAPCRGCPCRLRPSSTASR